MYIRFFGSCLSLLMLLGAMHVNAQTPQAASQPASTQPAVDEPTAAQWMRTRLLDRYREVQLVHTSMQAHKIATIAGQKIEHDEEYLFAMDRANHRLMVRCYGYDIVVKNGELLLRHEANSKFYVRQKGFDMLDKDQLLEAVPILDAMPEFRMYFGEATIPENIEWLPPDTVGHPGIRYPISEGNLVARIDPQTFMGTFIRYVRQFPSGAQTIHTYRVTVLSIDQPLADDVFDFKVKIAQPVDHVSKLKLPRQR
jgi:hypothetical protein